MDPERREVMGEFPPVVFFGEDWGRHPSTSQHLARELSARATVLWVNSLGLRVPRLSPSDVRRIGRKLADFAVGRASSVPLPTNLHVASPIAVPLLRSAAVRALNRVLVTRYLNRQMAALGLSRPIVIASSLAAVDVIDRLDAEMVVYYCGDDYSDLPGVDAKLVRTLESEVLGKAHLVLAASEALLEQKRTLHEHVVYFPHGVDYEHFKTALGSLPMPAALRPLRRPLIGFVGLLGEHIDFAIVDHLAVACPDATLVMVGPIEAGVTVPRRPNLVYTGAAAHRDLPSYLAHFDVCIVPYVTDTSRIRYANPTKIREYLAAGRAVVSTPQPEAQKLSEYVVFASGSEAFAAAVRSLLSAKVPLDRGARSRAMEAHTWASRAESLWALVGDSMRGRPSTRKHRY